MIYSKVLALIDLLKEVDEEVGGIVAIDGFNVWSHGLPVIQLSSADTLVEIAGMHGLTIELEKPEDMKKFYGSFKADGAYFRRFCLTDEEVKAIREYNTVVIAGRKEEFRKEMH